MTGASSGIGKRVAIAYAEAGAEVALAARNAEALEMVADEWPRLVGGPHPSVAT